MAAQCAPQTLVHIVFREVTPGIDPASFGAQPRSLYRLGNGKSRSEEADDPAQHIHQVFVTDEPNTWLADLDDGTGLHVVDPGPTFFTHSPEFIGDGVSPRLTQLEFGCEADFIKDNALSPIRVEQVEGESYDVYRLDANGDAVEILKKHDKTTPTFTRYFRAQKLLLAWRYDLYETELKSDSSLFAPLAGIKYEERSAVSSGAAAASPSGGSLYFVNLTKTPASLTVDDEAHAPPKGGEVQGRGVTSGMHVLHVAIAGWPPQELKVDFDPDHVAQDETGQTFWCVVAVVDAQARLRIVPFAPQKCSVLVAEGLHPAGPDTVKPEPRGDLYFINESGHPVDFSMDGMATVPMQNREIFGYSIPPGGHDMHLMTGADRSVDVHLNFDAQNIGHDEKENGYWCVGAVTRPGGALAVLQLDAPACTELIAAGAGKPAS